MADDTQVPIILHKIIVHHNSQLARKSEMFGNSLGEQNLEVFHEWLFFRSSTNHSLTFVSSLNRETMLSK